MTAKTTSSAGASLPELKRDVSPKLARMWPKSVEDEWARITESVAPPAPLATESEGQFMARCMASDEMPGEHEARTAACSVAWRRSLAVREAVTVSLREAVAPPPGELSLGVPREVMPQIPHDKLADYVRWLKRQGVHVEERDIPPVALKPTQGEIDTAKVEKIRRDGTATACRLVVSEEGRILDGLHRWSAAHADAPNVPVPCLVASLPIADLVLLTHAWPGVERRDVRDRSA